MGTFSKPDNLLLVDRDQLQANCKHTHWEVRLCSGVCGLVRDRSTGAPVTKGRQHRHRVCAYCGREELVTQTLGRTDFEVLG